ncbi:MAG: Zn-dependent hydrolase of the beta-lactamase fold-like protein [Parcubacteria group bacterium Athens1014_10]|nr:MAG: Zn-dependent hydrolase of the beta-lactamase fold-like protein [Parcubacteria group bacterium Athens1014_10]TSD04507.1 MAG: Zn-dependent hydrolase of the beta-lactamase fold-like protein [Parcubacteria group bacterium Athens0714_12]
MNLTYHGLNCFKIQGKNTTLVIDPKEDLKAGVNPPSFKADIICLNDPQEKISKIKPIQEKIFLISTPGEYEIGGIFIYSFFYPNQRNLIYHLQVEGINIVHLGNSNKPLDDQSIEKLNSVDILMVPVGGNDVLDAEKALNVINQLEPKIIIPMHYKTTGLNFKLDGIDKFCREMGIKTKESTDKLKIFKKDVSSMELKTIIMNIAN